MSCTENANAITHKITNSTFELRSKYLGTKFNGKKKSDSGTINAETFDRCVIKLVTILKFTWAVCQLPQL